MKRRIPNDLCRIYPEKKAAITLSRETERKSNKIAPLTGMETGKGSLFLYYFLSSFFLSHSLYCRLHSSNVGFTQEKSSLSAVSL